MREFMVVIHRAEEGGYWVEVPALPGCLSQGETLDEAVENVRAAIECHLEALTEEEGEAPMHDEVLIGRVAVGA